VAETLGVARSNLVEQLQGSTKLRGHYRPQGDEALLQAASDSAGAPESTRSAWSGGPTEVCTAEVSNRRLEFGKRSQTTGPRKGMRACFFLLNLRTGGLNPTPNQMSMGLLFAEDPLQGRSVPPDRSLSRSQSRCSRAPTLSVVAE
jgi:hypothetical protein